jgi:transcriptional regulator with XRE-family HTH domain
VSTHDNSSPARTLLAQKIRDRRMTFEKFAEFAERFALEHDEPGTLSVRHVQRLASGKGENGLPLGRPRAATARLLERIFGVSIETLLSPSLVPTNATDAEIELRQMLYASARVDASVLGLLQEQLTATRRLDRQLGAVVARDEVLAKAAQVTRLLDHSLAPTVREGLAAHLSELCTLAGWQALDVGDVPEAWRQYTLAVTVAAQSAGPAFAAHSAAGQAFTLVDLGDSRQAAELLDVTRKRAERRTSQLIRSWLAAAHGEALAADGQSAESLRAFDRAEVLLPDDPVSSDGPYVVLDTVHLGRWRGHALARLGEPSAVGVLTAALDRLDPTFTRAEVGLRVDLATAFTAIGERDAARHQAATAEVRAVEIGSHRQLRRLRSLN